MNYLLNKDSKNILVTGADGFIGSNLVSSLKKEYGIFSIPREVLDLRDIKKAKAYFYKLEKKYNFYTIIHLASRFASGKNISDMSILYDNLKITESIVAASTILKPKKLINFSSIAVYPNKDGKYKEDSEVKTSSNTECLYGLSKLSSENILDFMLKNQKIIISHLRIAQVYGRGMRKDRIIPIMLKELKGKNTITVFGKGERVSNFISIDKLVNVVKEFLKKDLSGTFNVGGEHLSYLDLAKRIIKKYGNKDSKIIKESSGSRAKLYLDTSKLKEALKNRHAYK